MSLGNLNINEYWDAAANKPKLVSGKGIHGQGYIVGTPGNTDLDGSSNWSADDIVIFVLDKWIKISDVGTPAGNDGDIQVKSGTSLAAISRIGGNLTDYLARDNTYRVFTGGGGGGTFTGTGDPGLTRAQHILTNYTTPPNVIRTTGWDAPADWGGNMHVKVDAQPDHKGWFQTADGTYYELFPDKGFVTPQMFGGKNVAVWNDRFPDAGLAANDAVDYICFNRFSKVDLLWPGGFFIGTTVQLKGGQFNVRGLSNGGTFIMPDYYTTGFMGHHNQWSFEVFGGSYGWRDFMVGETFYTAGGTPGTASAHTYICTVAGTTSSDGSQKPTGTGTGYVDGTAHFDYYREATRVELSNNAWLGELSHMQLYSHYDLSAKTGGSASAQVNAPAPGPWPQAASGLLAACGPWKPAFGFASRTRAQVHHCWMGGFSATGCIFAANGDREYPTMTGNVDYWEITDSQFYYNTSHGSKNSYSNGNAGNATHNDYAQNGCFGHRNQGFLGDNMSAFQSAYDGNARKCDNQRFPTSVAHAGYYYYALLGKLGAYEQPDGGAIAPTPGASNQAWGLLGGDGTWVTDNWNYPDWVSGYHYEPGGAYGSDNINARHTWIQMYIEGGTWPAQFNADDVQIGGLMQGLFIGAGRNLLQDGSWYQPITFQSRTHNFSASFGAGGTYSEKGEGVFVWGDGSTEYSLRSDSYENDGATYTTDNMAWCINRSRYGYWLKSGQTSKFYGEPSAVGGGAFVYHNLYVGSDGDCRKLDYADSKPTDGTGGRGARVYNRQADVGQPEGWICCGTGRVWKNMRTIT